MDWEGEGKRDWQMGECKKQELPITKPIVSTFFFSDFSVERDSDSKRSACSCFLSFRSSFVLL